MNYNNNPSNYSLNYSNRVIDILFYVFFYNFFIGLLTITIGRILYQMTGSAMAVSFIAISEYICVFFLQFLSAIIIDRGNPHNIAFKAVFITAISILIPICSSLIFANNGLLWGCLIYTVIFSITRIFQRGAFYSLGMRLVAQKELVQYHGNWYAA